MYEPHTVEAGPGGGVLSDLGSHLIDQYSGCSDRLTVSGTSPVPAEEAVAVIEIIDAARTSAAENRVVAI